MSLRAQSLLEQLDSVLASPPNLEQAWRLDTLADWFIYEKEEIPDTLFVRGLELAHEANSAEHAAWIYRDRYVYHQRRGEYDLSLAYIDDAIKYAELAGEDLLAQDIYLEKIDILLFAGRTKASADLASSLVKKFHDAGDSYAESLVYGSLSTISSGLGNHELTLRYDSIAMALALLTGDSRLRGKSTFTASVNLSILGYPEKALKLAEEALVIAEESDLEWLEEDATSARAEAYTAMGRYAKALEDYEVLKVGHAKQEITWRMIKKGLVLQRLGQHVASRELLQRALRLIKKNSNDPVELKLCYEALQTVGLNQAQYDTVVWYGKLMNAQQDSLQTAKNIKNLIELEEKYKAEEKEVKIRLQEVQLTKQRNKLYATIFGLLLAVVGGVVFFILGLCYKFNDEGCKLMMRKAVKPY